MNATAVAGSVPVTLQFSIPLMLLGNLTIGTQEPENRTVNFGLPPGYIAFAEDDLAYKLNKSWVTWHTARELCASDGGYLAVIDSQRKLDIMQEISDGHPWIGIHNFFNVQEWSSISDGSAVSFIQWWPQYPLDIEKHRCLFLIDSNEEAKHANQDCEDLRAYLCEIPIKKHCD